MVCTVDPKNTIHKAQTRKSCRFNVIVFSFYSLPREIPVRKKMLKTIIICVIVYAALRKFYSFLQLLNYPWIIDICQIIIYHVLSVMQYQCATPRVLYKHKNLIIFSKFK